MDQRPLGDAQEPDRESHPERHPERSARVAKAAAHVDRRPYTMSSGRDIVCAASVYFEAVPLFLAAWRSPSTT